MNVFIPGFSAVTDTPVPSKDGNDERYALTQRQRRMERDIRYAKREKFMLEASGAATEQDIADADAAIRRKQQKIRQFVAENEGLYRDYRREAVYTSFDN